MDSDYLSPEQGWPTPFQNSQSGNQPSPFFRQNQGPLPLNGNFKNISTPGFHVVDSSAIEPAPLQQEDNNDVTSSQTYSYGGYSFANNPIDMQRSIPQSKHAIKHHREESNVNNWSHEIPKQNDYNTRQNNTPRMKFIDDNMYSEISPTQFSNTKQNRIPIYEAILACFPLAIMTKTAIFSGFSVYKAAIDCMLYDGVRMIVAIVKNDSHPVGMKRQLSTLNWESFQTRHQTEDDEIKMFNLEQVSFLRPNETILNDIIISSRRSSSNSVLYNCSKLPLQVEILLKNSDESINERGTVLSALELFSTILSWIN